MLDQMENINNKEVESMFYNQLDLAQGIGIMGHSYGGSTSGQTCWRDSRFCCGVNIDCFNYGEYGFKDIKTPFLSIGANHVKRFGKSSYLMNSEDSYLVTIDRTAHLSFTDLPYLAPILKLFGIFGKRKKQEVTSIVTTYILTFFNKYLTKDLQVTNLEKPYPGVEFIANLQ